jgi:hypothetical protein
MFGYIYIVLYTSIDFFFFISKFKSIIYSSLMINCNRFLWSVLTFCVTSRVNFLIISFAELSRIFFKKKEYFLKPLTFVHAVMVFCTFTALHLCFINYSLLLKKRKIMRAHEDLNHCSSF